MTTDRPTDALLLALDAASPLVSVAVGRGGQPLAVTTRAIRRSAEHLLAMIAATLDEAGLTGPAQLDGLLALRGPGSFTGMRVGLATALGLHQALGLPAAGLSTLEVLATAAPSPPGAPVGAPTGTVIAAVDAIRDEWFVQPFVAGQARAEPRRIATERLPSFAPATIVGFGVTAALATLGTAAADLTPVEPGPLAPVALALAARQPPTWDSALLSQPLYMRPAPAQLPRRR